MQAIGLDIGGTKIAALRVDGAGDVLARETVPTPGDDATAIVSASIEAVLAVANGDVVGIGAGVAGMVDHDAGILRYAPNLAWRELPVAERLREGTGLRCVVDNDANAATWGEFRFGAGTTSNHMLMITVGTGIGGGIVTGGKLFRGANGSAGEVGHMIVEPDGPLCGCGNRGCWEQVASGTAIGRLGRRAFDEHPESSLAGLASARDHVDGNLVARAAREGDEVARGVLSAVGRRLGEGLAALANVLDPDLIVVGGGAVEAGDLLLDPARAAFRDALEAPEHRPDIRVVAAALGNDAGAIGAAALAMEELGK